MDQESLHKEKHFSFWDIVTWIVIIIFLIWGAFSMGKNSNKKLTPQEVREENTRCRQWTGEDCQPYSAD